MPFSIDRVVPWGRSSAEYQAMFRLGEPDLGRRILAGMRRRPRELQAVVDRTSPSPILETARLERHTVGQAAERPVGSRVAPLLRFAGAGRLRSRGPPPDGAVHELDHSPPVDPHLRANADALPAGSRSHASAPGNLGRRITVRTYGACFRAWPGAGDCRRVSAACRRKRWMRW